MNKSLQELRIFVKITIFRPLKFGPTYMVILSLRYRRAPFEGYKFCEWSKKEFVEIISLNDIGRTLYNTCELTHMEFLLSFGETNFVEVPKIYEIRKIYGP